MKTFLLSALVVFGLLGCRSATTDSDFGISEEERAVRALRDAEREADQQRRKDNEDYWKKRELARSDSTTRFTQPPPDLELLRERAAASDPIADINGFQIYQFEDRIYAQQMADGKVETEVVGDSWKQDNDELVFSGDVAAQKGDTVYGTNSENSEIRFLPNGKFVINGNKDKESKGRARVSWPIRSSPSDDPNPGFLPANR